MFRRTKFLQQIQAYFFGIVFYTVKQQTNNAKKRA